MDIQRPPLEFPNNFCCNCGDTNCASEPQDTRVTRFFRIGGTETRFQLALPICARCRRTTRREPVGIFGRLFLLAAAIGVTFVLLVILGIWWQIPTWLGLHVFALSVIVGVIFTGVFYYLRRARPPRTSFYQPVRIRRADVHFAGVMHGPGQVVYMKIAFTNPEYLNLFRDANRDAISAGHLAAVRA